MEQILEKLFESVPRTRLLRTFLRNSDEHFTLNDVMKRTQLKKSPVKTELAKLLKIGLLKTKIDRFRYEVKKKFHSRKKPPKISVRFKKERVYYANPEIKILEELKALVAKASIASREKLLKQIKGLGNVKLCVISGVFLNGNISRTDLLLVGGIKRKKLDRLLANIESEIGKQLRYTVMDVNEFKYRMNMYDRFLRDILEEPHEKLINKLHV